MSSTPLINTNDAGLIARAYNLGLKVVPNFPHILSVGDLSYWEEHLDELKGALATSLVLTKSEEKKAVGYTKQILADKKISVPSTTKGRKIAEAGDVFKSGIYFDFDQSECNYASISAAEVATSVYEMIKNANFQTIYGSFGVDLDSLCFTQEQIISWVETNPQHLRQDGYGTFLLFKEDGKFFVADVIVDSVGLYVHVNRLSRGSVWYAGYRLRLVIPQLTPTVPSV